MADEKITIGLPEMTMGFNPGAGGTQRLTRLLGPGRALEMMLEGETLSPPEAHQAGLIHRVLPSKRLLAAAIEAGERLATRSPESIRGLKRSVYEGAAGSLEQGLAAERKWFMSEAGTEHAMAAMAAFVDEVSASGESPWVESEQMERWQRGTAAG
jgi:enoyl-CoA hydratase/carnithine racemase